MILISKLNLFQIKEWCNCEFNSRRQGLLLLILDQLAMLVKTQKEKVFICQQMINLIKKIKVCVIMASILVYYNYTPAPRKGRGVYCFTSVLPSVQDIFRHIFLSNCWWQKSDIWSQASYRYTILWVVFLDPSDSYFLFADLVGLYTHWTYMHIFRHIFPSNYWWQKSDIWSQASYRYTILWVAFLDPSDSYFLFADFVGFYTHLTYICICPFLVAFF